MTAESTLTPPRPRIAVTLGDLSGIGPEITAKLVAKQHSLERADVYLLASEEEIASAADEAGVTVALDAHPSTRAATARPGRPEHEVITPGEVSEAAGSRALADLRHALDLYEAGEVDGILFAPLNKSALTQAGMHQEDELRWFADQLGFTGTTSELNFAPGLVTARVTSHIPIKAVADHLDANGVVEACALLNRTIQAQGNPSPRLAVCALNPHGGENGKFGTEEIDHIAPGVVKARAAGIDASGPFPCDTLFIEAFDGGYDGVVTMYHDQGQIALKLRGFEEGVTVLGGLPVPIATPAHGTAHGIVGQGKASTGPIERAFDIAVNLAARNLVQPDRYDPLDQRRR